MDAYLERPLKMEFDQASNFGVRRSSYLTICQCCSKVADSAELESLPGSSTDPQSSREKDFKLAFHLCVGNAPHENVIYTC